VLCFYVKIKFHYSRVFLILFIKQLKGSLNVPLEKVLKSEQFLTDRGNLLKSFASSSWNVPDSIGMTRDIPELDLKVLVCLTMSTFE